MYTKHYEKFDDINEKDEVYIQSKKALDQEIKKQQEIQERENQSIIQNQQSYLQKFIQLFQSNKPQNQDRSIQFNKQTNIENINKIKNEIKNSKYNLLTFLPLVLYNQFKHFFNLLYLFVAGSQFIPFLQIGYFWGYVGPLVYVLGFGLAKELIDDLRRHYKDQQSNNAKYKVVTKQIDKQIKSMDIQVGDILEIEQNQRIPADLVILAAEEPNGSIFIRTDQLDGETDWKVRRAIKDTQNIYLRSGIKNVISSQHQVIVEGPSHQIYKFEGQYYNIHKNTKEPLSLENVIWQNSIITNSKIYGLVIYHGYQTRSNMNSRKPRSKFGIFDCEVNKFCQYLFVLSLILSGILISLKGFIVSYKQMVVEYLRYFLILCCIVPISVRVHTDMSKSIFCYFISSDQDIKGCKANNSDIPEELGRVSYVLTDKTGTLTQNDMIFKKISTFYNTFNQEDFQQMKQILKGQQHMRQNSNQIVNNSNSMVQQQISYTFNEIDEQQKTTNNVYNNKRNNVLYDLVMSLSICNTVNIIRENKNEMDYQASSPDEMTLVKFAQECGFTLYDRKNRKVQIVIRNQIHQFNELNCLQFNSEIKRMGVIIQNPISNQIILYLKGADNIMCPKLKKVYQGMVQDETEQMAREGLRTLVFAQKVLSQSQYQSFQQSLDQAQLSMQDRTQQIYNCWTSIESEMELLGVTGVEDKLQDKVNDTIESLRYAGIKIWMLTGDKVETAKCIAIAAGFKLQQEEIFMIKDTQDPLQLHNLIIEYSYKLDEQILLIDGSCLESLFTHNYQKLFFEIVSQAKSVIFARCSPLQKAYITQKLKDYSQQRVLSIGDGGNDVGMIQVADLGIGIFGKEGIQAALASDFAITEFKHLKLLLLWYGRQSYKRSAAMVKFIFQRGQLISFIQFYFIIIFYYSSIPCYNGYLIMLYTSIYTSWPVMTILLDEDVSKSQALRFPVLYQSLQKNRDFSSKQYLIWLLMTLYQGGIILIYSIYIFKSYFLYFVTTSYSALILSEFFNLILIIYTFKKHMLMSILLSILTYFMTVIYLRDVLQTSIIDQEFIFKLSQLVFISCFPFWILDQIMKYLDPNQEQKIMMQQ